MLEKLFIDKMLTRLEHGTLAIEFWDGTKKSYGHGDPVVKIKANTRGVVRAIMRNLSLGIGEGYMNGQLEISEPLDQLFRVVYQNQKTFEKLVNTRLTYRRKPNKKQVQKNYIAHHYDLSNDFYKLWLDNDTMAYTCA